jgi:signal transduction histidine kinase
MAAESQQPRTRSAWLTIVGLLLIPLLSLLALWIFTASISLGNVLRFERYNRAISLTTPSFTKVEPVLIQERALSLAYLGADRQIPVASLQAARQNTDKVVVAIRAALAAANGLFNPASRGQENAFLAALNSLPRIRAAVDSGQETLAGAVIAYGSITTAEYDFFHISAPPSDPTLSLMNQASVSVGPAEDATSGALSLLGGVLAHGGRMSQAERVVFAQLVEEQNLDVNFGLSVSTGAEHSLFVQAFTSPGYRGVVALENRVLASPFNRLVPVSPTTLATTGSTFQAQITPPLSRLSPVLAARSAHLSDGLVTELALAGGLGLVAVIASVFVAVRFGRRLGVELTGLYDSARQTASERLPRLVERLRRGEDVDVEAESPPLPRGQITEIAHVADAFWSVQRTAVEAAVGQASLRKGVNQVFLSLSLRSQSLLHRQLGMLDTMERATDDPAALADLFRLDHLTTRMRRHAEGLIILSGATPGRGWRDPVPMVDVLRAAIAEVEDYVRVDMVSEAPETVAGTAVNDVIHLLAELIENATAFSPPNTRVEIRGDTVGKGFAVEVEDRGLGLTPDDMATINANLASPPEFDLAKSDQLGLFVTGRLAARHGIRVSLRPSPFEGITAVVLLPHEIIAHAHEEGGWPGLGSPARASGGLIGSLDAGGPGGGQRSDVFSPTGGHHRHGSPPVDGPTASPAPGPSPRRGAVQPGIAGSGASVPDTSGPAISGHGAGVPGTAGPGTAGLNAPGRPQSRAPGSPLTGGTHRGLPRRIRQANLAPQLRGQATSAAAGAMARTKPAAAGEATGFAARSPEEIGTMMSSLQEGWRRGRVDDVDYPDANLHDGPGSRPGGWPGGTPGPEPTDRGVQS